MPSPLHWPLPVDDEAFYALDFDDPEIAAKYDAIKIAVDVGLAELKAKRATGYTVDQARAEYKAQPRIAVLRAAEIYAEWYFDNPEDEFDAYTREEYAERKAAMAVPGYALLTTDGRWVARGARWAGSAWAATTPTPPTRICARPTGSSTDCPRTAGSLWWTATSDPCSAKITQSLGPFITRTALETVTSQWHTGVNTERERESRNPMNTTGPVTVRDYVQTSHQQFDMISAAGEVIAHRYQHIVTGNHYVRDYLANGTFGAPIYSGPSEIEARKAWVRLYRKYN